MISSIIPLWKPVNWTSFDVVKNIRNQIKPARVGHAGSLDPFAEGIVMICTGNKTKSIELLMDQEKEYIAEIHFGIETNTLDMTGVVVKNSDIPAFSENVLKEVLSNFIGETMQEPPMFSALKVKGQPLYKLARKGITVKRKKRKINIYEINLQSFTSDSIIISVLCGRGTYIRSLAKDISEKLHTVGHLTSLKRIRIGEFKKQDCIYINDFQEWIFAQT